ncbi:MAG: cob(I)yrinic acid a,c-diamide adenosyltransferase [Candidatus Aureabacteria bacterium]|nr:cob(I)yrinic acid a,c-diamide adenosyltransferase [Candidatus Auribacterota bacterium]
MAETRLSRGLIQVYTGDGKGKTTAAVGLAARALGWGKKVCLIQFMKGGACYGELKILGKIRGCRTARFGRGCLLRKGTIKPIDRREAEKGLAFAGEVVAERKADVVILDEINVAVHFGLIPREEVTKLIQRCPKRIELVLIGRRCPREIMRLADYVSDIREIKHPYRKGVQGRRGIEY